MPEAQDIVYIGDASGQLGQGGLVPEFAHLGEGHPDELIQGMDGFLVFLVGFGGFQGGQACLVVGIVELLPSLEVRIL
jgi:hypothetical protein